MFELRIMTDLMGLHEFNVKYKKATVLHLK